MKHELPKLPYSYNALEPYFDEQTMILHHTKHHQTYVDKLNIALEKHPNLQNKKVEDLLKDLNKIPEEIRTAVRNHGGGHFNHSFWWPMLKKNPNGKPIKEISRMIDSTFGSFEKFKEQFTNSALGLFGSGWTWLVVNKGKLEIINLPNQDSPISQGKIPIMGIDLWEHGFYKKWGPDKKSYIEAFWNVVNWDKVNENYKNIIKK